ncbi:MAG: DUF1569 domain-containing protein [bacterium]|nr:DUF1569 domain-containing protein [bacterium]
MKHLQDRKTVDALKMRIEKLTFDTQPLWGKFNAHQMLCHLQDTMEYGLGMAKEAQQLEKGPPMFIRNLIRLYIPMPKGKIKTGAEFLVTQPDNWEKDKAQVIQLMDRFPASANTTQWPMHPFFGHLDAMAWAKVLYRHNDHHFRQFGL